jgi:hypothetical protein
MSKIDFKKRTIYAKITWDKESKKKKVWFGKQWGDLTKREANATAILTGDGLVVLDIDTKDFDELDKELSKILKKLGKPTVESKRGYHYYFIYKKSKRFVNKASYSHKVDIRSDGGLVLNSYIGKDKKHIQYKRIGNVYDKMPKKLEKFLLDRMELSKNKMRNRVQWERVESGEIHDTTLRYALRDFRKGLSLDEVILNGLAYVEKYLHNRPREVKLMTERIKWAYQKYVDDKFEKSKTLDYKNEPAEIGGELEDGEVLEMLRKAQRGGALELERVMKDIKKKLGISIGTQKQMLVESPDDAGGLSELFRGEVVWASNLGVFAEVLDGSVRYYTKANFIQTCVSKSGYLTSSEVSERLCSIASKIVEYNPTKRDGRDGFDEFGEATINTYSGIDFEAVDKQLGGVKKIPKTIGRILDNLFDSDMKAKEYFIQWLAYIVQIGGRTGVAWTFYGASGSGKGLMIDIISNILGRQNCSLNVGDSDLQSSFNSYIANTQFVQLNEIASDFHSRHGVSGRLKAMISDPVLRLNQKNMPELDINNYVNIIINSNKPNPVEVDKDDRRMNFVVSNKALTSNDWWKGDKSYQKAIKEAMAFGAYLNKVKLNINKATSPMPMSEAKKSIISQTTSDLDLLGDAITKSDYETIIDILDLDESDFDITINEVKNSCKDGLWSNDLLRRIYERISNKSTFRPYDYKKYFIKPYIKNVKMTVFKQNGVTLRGYTISKV